MSNTIYIVIETTSRETIPTAFKTEAKANAYIAELLKEYSQDYKREISDYRDLIDLTFGQCSIEIHTTSLEGE